MNNTRKLKLASVLAIALIIAACGGNDDKRDANASADNSVNAGTAPATGAVPGAGTAPATGAVPGAGTVPDTGGGSAVAASIPDSAKANGNSFIGFLNSLKNDETSEPLLIGDGFAVPADEIDEPRPVG